MSTTASPRPDPFVELRMTSLRTLRGINYWSRQPVTRMELNIGEYDAISSAEIPGLSDALLHALPGLEEHHCSVGERGGFVVRLERGTYAAHIIEHVALELQLMIGHRVGFGRTRGAGAAGSYTIVVEHEHEAVGRRALVRAVEIVRLALAGTLHAVEREVTELRELATRPSGAPLPRHVTCGITGGDAALRAATQGLLLRRLTNVDPIGSTSIEDLAPASLLALGVPYLSARAAIILDVDAPDVPERFQGRESAVRIVSTLADAVERGGVVVCRVEDRELRLYAHECGCRVAVFSTTDGASMPDAGPDGMFGGVRDGRLWIEDAGVAYDAGHLMDDLPPEAQLSAALVLHALESLPREMPDDFTDTITTATASPGSELDVVESRTR